MINATKEKLGTFYQGNLQYEIPFFQRSYVWNEENWLILWEHLNDILKNLNGQVPKEHFIGTIITKQIENTEIWKNKYEIIDGQQRLTTICLLLKALHDSCNNDLPNLKNLIYDRLTFRNANNDIFYRLSHNRHDKPYFEKIMQLSDKEDISAYLNKNDSKDNLILGAYTYFRNIFDKLNDNTRNSIFQIVLNKIPVISMLLSTLDDEQEIFDTINSLGVRLTIAELLKNFIFQDTTIRNLFEEYWESIFEYDEEYVKFWNETKTSGRIRRTNIEVLLYCYLIIKTEKGVEIEKLYQEYKKWLKEKNSEEKEAFLKELNSYAEIYFDFPTAEELNEISFNEHEKRFFHVIEYLEITTVYPLVLFVYKNVSEEDEKIEILRILESYLVRRNICGLTNKNYNNLFISLIRNWKEKGIFNKQTFLEILDSFKEETNIFPGDEDFRNKFVSSHLYNAHSREILYCITLYAINTPLDDVRKLSSSSFSVEHIMPKKWEENWNVPDISEKDKELRNHLILTLGNLTLVTGNLNSKMKNSSWEKKKNILKEYSKLKITTKYLDKQDWNEEEINTRGKELKEIAIKIWKRN